MTSSPRLSNTLSSAVAPEPARPRPGTSRCLGDLASGRCRTACPSSTSAPVDRWGCPWSGILVPSEEGPTRVRETRATPAPGAGTGRRRRPGGFPWSSPGVDYFSVGDGALAPIAAPMLVLTTLSARCSSRVSARRDGPGPLPVSRRARGRLDPDMQHLRIASPAHLTEDVVAVLPVILPSSRCSARPSLQPDGPASRVAATA